MSDVLTTSFNNITGNLIIMVDEVRTSSPEFHGIFSGWQWEFLRGKLLRAGFKPDTLCFKLLKDVDTSLPIEGAACIVGMGEKVLRAFTNKSGIDKWQLSPLRTNADQLFIPTFDIGRVQKQFELGLYQELAFRRAHQKIACQVTSCPTQERFFLNPSFYETLTILDQIKTYDTISVDIETGYGQINTIGIAWSKEDAIAINVLPDNYSDQDYYTLWKKIASVLESDSKKILQNFIYDVSYLSSYGIRVQNVFHDTMWAMKVLWPELDMNLGNVGRIYTERPYWKDDGKVESEEGKRKDWGNVRDWTRHYLYNCRDTTGTFEAHINQRNDLRDRKLIGFYDNYIMSLAEPILEMCSHGMPICKETKEKLKKETEEKIKELHDRLHAEVGLELNPRSPKQVHEYLKENNVKIPKKYDKTKGEYRDSTDSSAIKKLRIKYPHLKALDYIAEIRTLDKAYSSYIDFKSKTTNRLSYSLNGTGTETLRFSGGKDPWGMGFNIQTLPREGGDVSIKQMIRAPEGKTLVEIDLKQAESKFVAYDSADKTLIDMLESGQDVHRYVAAEIFSVSEKDVTKDQRQLGKKAGHGANYSMKESVFAETCFDEMGLILSKDQAKKTLDAYHKLFPGIRKWHSWIRQELSLKRKLSAPSGWERYFYGRFGDDMFKEAYAWRPQHTIPWITNHLMFHLRKERSRGQYNFDLLVQVHDSLILLVEDSSVGKIIQSCIRTKDWHPEIILPGGKLVIPTEVKFGKSLDKLKEMGG